VKACNSEIEKFVEELEKFSKPVMGFLDENKK